MAVGVGGGSEGFPKEAVKVAEVLKACRVDDFHEIGIGED